MMSDIINAKKITVIRDCIVGKKCDVCGKDIPPTVIPHKCGELVYDYYEVTTHHSDWGSDSVDSCERFDACSPDCACELWKEYIDGSAGTRNTMCIEVEHKTVGHWNIRRQPRMPDREKAIKGLEICTSRPCYCTDCPYKANCYLDSQEVMEDALSLLREQEAVMPVKQIEQTEWTVCGNCCNHIISKWTFCPYCGKAVKWE